MTFCDFCDRFPAWPGDGIRSCPRCRALEHFYEGDLARVWQHLEIEKALARRRRVYVFRLGGRWVM